MEFSGIICLNSIPFPLIGDFYSPLMIVKIQECIPFLIVHDKIADPFPSNTYLFFFFSPLQTRCFFLAQNLYNLSSCNLITSCSICPVCTLPSPVSTSTFQCPPLHLSIVSFLRPLLSTNAFHKNVSIFFFFLFLSPWTFHVFTVRPDLDFVP